MALEDITLPQEVRVSGSIIVLEKANTTGHFVYTSLGSRLQDGIIGTSTNNFPLHLFSRIRDKFKPLDFPGDTDSDRIYDLNNFGKPKYAVVLNFSRTQPNLRDAIGRLWHTYAHAVVLDQRPVSAAQVYEQVEKMYLESTRAPTLKQAVEQIHEQAQNAVLKRDGNTRALSALFEKLIAM